MTTERKEKEAHINKMMATTDTTEIRLMKEEAGNK